MMATSDFDRVDMRWLAGDVYFVLGNSIKCELIYMCTDLLALAQLD